MFNNGSGMGGMGFNPGMGGIGGFGGMGGNGGMGGMGGMGGIGGMGGMGGMGGIGGMGGMGGIGGNGGMGGMGGFNNQNLMMNNGGWMNMYNPIQQNNVNNVNNTNFNINNNPGGIPGKINVVFKTTMGVITNVLIDHGKTMSELFQVYLKKVDKFELFNTENTIFFLFNARKIGFLENTRVEQFFAITPNPTIVVNDIRGLIGA